MNTNELDKLFDRVKVALLVKGAIFLPTIGFSLKMVFTDKVPTASVDGITIRFNPEFFMALNEEERLFVYVHEIWHVAFKHIERVEEKNLDPKKWNKAGDYVINLMMVNAGYKMPAPPFNGLIDVDFEGLSTKEVYDLLPDDPEDYDCDVIPMEGTPEEILEQEVKVNQIINNALTTSKIEGEDIGNIPNSITRMMDKLNNPILPWRDILSSFLNDKTKEDYSWSKPNRRFLPNYYLPSQYSESLASLAFAIDTSGSVDDDMLKKMLSEINYIKEVLKPESLKIISFDTKIKEIIDVDESMEILDLNLTGWGGTDTTDIIDWGVENNPTALIIFTDGQFSTYEPKINFPLLWIIYDNPNWQSSIGDITYYDI